MKYEVSDTHASPHNKIIPLLSLRHNSTRAFTVVELIVSVGIFVFLTVLLIVKYGNFNQNVLLTNLAYDVAVTIRTAQTYGLSVKRAGTGDTFANFQYAYGVHFDPTSTTNSTTLKLFAFTPAQTQNYTYGVPQTGITKIDVTTYTLKRGARITAVCTGDPCTPTSADTLDIIFRRPNPNADICLTTACNKLYAEITITGKDGNTRIVAVRENGQISVKQN